MIKTLQENKLGRDFVIGDLQGNFDMLQRFMQHINFDQTKDRIISVGDLIDRGPKSPECLELILEPWFHSVKGNHEQLMEDWMTGGPTGAWWFPNGGQWFHDLDIARRDFLVNQLLPSVQTLPWIITVEGTKKFHVIHAELPASVTDEELADPNKFRTIALRQSGDGETCIWGRFTFGAHFAEQLSASKVKILEESKANHSRIFCGHTPLQHPLTINGMTNIDTGAFLVGRRNWAGLTVINPITDEMWKIRDNDIL